MFFFNWGEQEDGGDISVLYFSACYLGGVIDDKYRGPNTNDR